MNGYISYRQVNEMDENGDFALLARATSYLSKFNLVKVPFFHAHDFQLLRWDNHSFHSTGKWDCLLSWMCQSQYNLLLGLRLCGLACSNEMANHKNRSPHDWNQSCSQFNVCYLLFVIIGPLGCSNICFMNHLFFMLQNESTERKVNICQQSFRNRNITHFVLRQAWRTLRNPNYRCINYIFSHHFYCLVGILETKSRICIFLALWTLVILVELCLLSVPVLLLAES